MATAAATDVATEQVDTQRDSRDAKLAANIDVAKDANTGNPDGHPKTIVDSELGVARSRLDGVKPDAEELALATRRRLLVEQGKAEEAQRLYAEASDQAKLLSELLQKAEAERDLARAKEAETRTTFLAQLEKNQRDNERKLREAVDAERNKFLRIITYSLTFAGVVCGLIAAFSAYVSVQAGDLGKAGLRAGVWLLFAGIFVAAAWTLNQAWFRYVMIGGLVLIVAAVGLMVYVNWRDAREKRLGRQRTTEADEAEDTLVRVMKTLDDTLPPDHAVFTALRGAMSDNNKALIHELRAEQKRTVTAPTPP